MTTSPGIRSNTSSGVVTELQRQGAGAVYLSAHHPDIMQFLDTKRENADEKIRIKTLSLGVVIPDTTFHLARDNKDMYLFSPYDVEKVEGKPMSECSVTENYHKWVEDDRIRKSKVSARRFFQTLSELQFESGYPYVLFEDTANRNHPMKHAGRVNLSNLCSEIAQLNSASEMLPDLTYTHVGEDISCNLGSLNVQKMLELDQEEFIGTVRVAVRALDQVSRMTDIDAVPTVAQGNAKSRAIGLGQMNLHGALADRHIHYGSERALELWDNYMTLVTYAAMLESSELAKDFGVHAYWEGCEYQTGEWFDRTITAWNERGRGTLICDDLHAPNHGDWDELQKLVQKQGMANAYLQAIPPTGSISYVNNSTSSIHPIASKIEIRKEGKVGRVYYPAPHMRTDNLEYFKDAYEIGYEKLIDTYAVSQFWVDQAQSCTLFFPAEATTRDLDRARIYAWRKGVKSLYYIRLRQVGLAGTEVGESIDECTSCML